MGPDYLRLDRGEKSCMVSDPPAESGHQPEKSKFFLGERGVKYLWYTTLDVDTDMKV